MALKDRIADILKDQDITQVQLAEVAGVTKGWVNQWLDGRGKSISYEAAVSISRKYGYAIDWLISGKPPEMASEQDVAQARGADISDLGLEVGRAFDQLSAECKEHVQRQIELLRMADVHNGRRAAQHDLEIKGGMLQSGENKRRKKSVR